MEEKERAAAAFGIIIFELGEEEYQATPDRFCYCEQCSYIIKNLAVTTKWVLV